MNAYDSLLSKLVEEGELEVDEVLGLSKEQREKLALSFMDKSELKDDYYEKS